ncbi:hypothetical protein Celaphus_00013684 [Cervus elaphus hippelaphus]|uniref:Uncharacterized protein n=1 Tax=Cervus elaphus hippelaphus TaxID=46360 RepID=A0A212CDU7_CEREH|nr:hypothetical protein Celaphus_00013684 [Cervus elaphus hippelaphus]
MGAGTGCRCATTTR